MALNSLHQISELLWSIKDQQTLTDFLEDILTPQEVEIIAERIDLCRQLLNHKTQREIAQKKGISVTTVTRGARMIQYGTGGIKKVLS